MLYINDQNWVKFAYEDTDLGYPAVVSVVIHEVSDDCNGEAVQASISENDTVYVGITAQSPSGKECKVQFSHIEYCNESVKNFRKGI